MGLLPGVHQVMMRHNVTCHCRLPEGAAAQQFDHERDIVAFDLVLVMDKFCAADVLREVGPTAPCMAGCLWSKHHLKAASYS